MVENIHGLGDRLKSVRIQNNLSRKQVAEQIGVSVSIVGLYESNIRQPSLSNLIKLAALFKVSTDYLLDINASGKKVLSLEGLTDKQIEALQLTADCFRNYGRHFD